jgi:serine protease Do
MAPPRSHLPPCSFLVRLGGLLLLGLVLSGPANAAPAPAAPVPLPAALEKPAPESLEELKAIQEQAKKVIARVMPAVVGVRVGAAQGSGVIVSEDGYVLTAGHVSGIPDRDIELILPDGKKLKGKSLGRNGGIDSGMLKITTEGKWPFVPLGKSAELKRGQWCLTLGHPGGYKPGRTPVVRLGRVLTANDEIIRTDCTLVGGDSGGPLFDLQGRLIGIHSRIGSNITDNIHVPVDTYRETWDRLAKGESWGGRLGERIPVAPPYLGVQLDREAKDVRVVEVVEGSPAEKAGLKAKDLIVKIDGQKIATLDDLSAVLAKKKPGDSVTVEVQRDARPMSLKITLGRRPG